MSKKEQLSTENELSQLSRILARRFVQRQDRYARQLDDGRYVAVHQPLQEKHLVAHLRGEITLGVYVLNEQSEGCFLVLDADDDREWAQLGRLAHLLHREGIPSYLETSRRGGHQWFFFEQTLAGQHIREFATGLLQTYEVPGSIEIYPKQDALTTGPGSLIRLPFGIHRRSGRRHGFLHPTGQPLAPSVRLQLALLNAPKSVSSAQMQPYRQKAKQEPEIPPTTAPEEQKRVAVYHATENAPVSERIKAAISIRDFIEIYLPDVRLNAQGAGYCPFHNDTHRSFGVHDERNFWHCYAGCGGGSLIDLWMLWRRKQGLDDNFTATVKDLAQRLL